MVHNKLFLKFFFNVRFQSFLHCLVILLVAKVVLYSFNFCHYYFVFNICLFSAILFAHLWRYFYNSLFKKTWDLFKFFWIKGDLNYCLSFGIPAFPLRRHLNLFFFCLFVYFCLNNIKYIIWYFGVFDSFNIKGISNLKKLQVSFQF